MKKIISSLLILSTVAISATYAGGPEIPPPERCFTPYIDGEIGAAWLDIRRPFVGGFGVDIIDGISVNISDSRRSEDQLAGRVAIGGSFAPFSFMSMWNLRFLTEVGYGYYGSQKFRNSAAIDLDETPLLSANIRSRTIVSGFDVVAGISADVWDNFSVFFKAGGIVENFSNHTKIFSGPGILNPLIDLDEGRELLTTTKTRSQALPVIMTGVGYNLTNWLRVQGTYLHSFGSNHHDFSLNNHAPYVRAKSSAPTVDAAFGGIVLSLPG